jgi:putative phosphoesterase
MSSSVPIVVGVISDTHGLLRHEALAALEGSNYIIHAGDIGDRNILDQLAEIAPVTAIRGNVDCDLRTHNIPESNVLEAGEVLIYTLHNLAMLDFKAEAAGFSAVVYGHTHVPKQEVKNKVLYFNPGAAGPRRFKLPVSVGKLIVANGTIQGAITILDVRAQ